MKEITFIHAADLHLDSPFKGLTQLPTGMFEEVRASTFSAFDALIQQAIHYQIDFLLLVGDLFDHEVPSLKAQLHLRDAFMQLQPYNIQVYLSYGNHDYLHKGSHQVTFPENVHVFADEAVQSFFYEKEGIPMVEIHGFSYEKRAVTEEKINEYPVRNSTIPFHIGMLHGSVYGNTTHQAYAPFQLRQLEEKSYDYWALGHIHKRTVLREDPMMIYPGNIQGRHRKETGEKGCYLVHMTEQASDVTFMPLHQIQFVDAYLNIADKASITDTEKYIQQKLRALPDHSCLIHLTWTGVAPDQFGDQTDQLLYELIEVINTQMEKGASWQFIYKTKVQFDTVKEQQINALFLEEAMNAFQDLDVQKEISDLIQHPKARKLLDLPSDEALLSEAKDTLMRKLLQKSEG